MSENKTPSNRSGNLRKPICLVLIVVLMATATTMIIMEENRKQDQELFSQCAALINSHEIESGVILDYLKVCLITGIVEMERQLEQDQGFRFLP